MIGGIPKRDCFDCGPRSKVGYLGYTLRDGARCRRWPAFGGFHRSGVSSPCQGWIQGRSIDALDGLKQNLSWRTTWEAGGRWRIRVRTNQVRQRTCSKRTAACTYPMAMAPCLKPITVSALLLVAYPCSPSSESSACSSYWARVIALKTPAYESADEPDHVQNIETLVSGRWYSMDAFCGRFDGIELHYCSGDEAQQAPLYYLVMAGWQRVVGVPAQPPYKGQPLFLDKQGGLFRHHSAADHRFLLWLRFPNIVFGALTVVVAYLAVRLITRDPWTPVVAAAFVAFLPRFVFLSAFVTNDNLVDLLGAILVYLALRFLIAPSRWRMAWVGAVFGLLVTTKLSALPVALGVIVLACLISGWRRRAEYAAIGIGSALLVSAWYLIQNAVRYGDPLAQAVTKRYLELDGGLGTLLRPHVVSDPLKYAVVQVPRRIVQSFWYQSGWINSPGPYRSTWPSPRYSSAPCAGSLAEESNPRFSGLSRPSRWPGFSRYGSSDSRPAPTRLDTHSSAWWRSLHWLHWVSSDGGFRFDSSSLPRDSSGPWSRFSRMCSPCAGGPRTSGPRVG